jgi:hypothetical protein
MHQDELHHLALDVAKRILYGVPNERYELGVTAPGENTRIFDDLVGLAEQLLSEEQVRRTYQAAA